MRLVTISMVFVVLLTGCAAPGVGIPGGDELARAWRYGQHLLPQSALRENQFKSISEIRAYPDAWVELVAANKIKPEIKLPAVVYLHGCAGNRNGDYWGKLVNGLGFAFFAPDSLARPRESLCDTGNMKKLRIPLRNSELRYARRQLKRLDWIDQSRIVLLGFSEGAQTAAAYSGDEFAAIVLMGTNCRFSGGSPKAASSIAVLSLMGKNDRYYEGLGCRIKRTVSGSKSRVIDGAGHNLRNNKEAVSEIRKFLQYVLRD
ncbi:MAG: hypothetical protein [Olavius algarvensis Gamma 3 endosymbiont]|nr:MAG: hypothetical protein [Olavius algarvensis Gamma 3 endosymbiont]